MTSKQTLLEALKEAPAFGHGDPVNGGASGLTKREYFAALFMAQYLTHYDATDAEIATYACQAADALCEALIAQEQETEHD